MTNIKLYQCFHDQGSIPDSKYIDDIRPALLCGASLKDRGTDNITNCLRDNAPNGLIYDDISSENRQYSELTGYYWIWKHQPEVDIVGIEHYRRHFIKHEAIIDDYVHSEDLITKEDIANILLSYDYIVPVHESLWNTSVYDLYVICFHEQADEIVKWMAEYFKDKPNYLEAVYNYFSQNELYRGNMIITTKREFDNYCKVMFDMLFYMKKHMTVEPDSRVWGYVSEVFPMIYIMANNKTFKEVDVAIDDFDWETQTASVHTTQKNEEGEFKNNPKEQIEYFKTLRIKS